MSRQMAVEEYALALRKGQKEYRELVMAGRSPYPAVLDEILPEDSRENALDIGVLEIPSERIIGVKSQGRITAFSASFYPLLDADSEFGIKWINLCEDHLDSTGIREPILCYEYLGNFYVQEGNKRVSVLKHFGAPLIPSQVIRIIPPKSDDPRIRAYYEFIDFYKSAKLYTVQFRRPGDYARLLNLLGKQSGEAWTQEERRIFNAYFHYFRDAFSALNTKNADILPEEALLVWLRVFPFPDLGQMTAAHLKKSLSALWDDVLSVSREEVSVETKANARGSLFTRLRTGIPDSLHVAFVHQLEPSVSAWVLGHEDGRRHIEQTFGPRVVCRSYYGASTPNAAEELICQAVSDGAQVVFTTAPILSQPALKCAVKYPKVRFFNCSVDQPYSSVRTYYGRIYEAKFITGAIAGAIAQNDRIGYIASYPIFGVPASINAFALGAQMTNPRAQIELRWSCCEGTPQADFFRDGIRVISNRDVPTGDKMYLDFCNYGTYLMDDRGGLIPLASPVWVWGKFYEFVVRAIFSGAWRDEKSAPAAVNYWLGMDSGVIGVNFSDKLPAGIRALAGLLRKNMESGSLDPFLRKIVAQNGELKNDGTRAIPPSELLHMNWLCSNVIGEIPTFDKIRPASQAMVRELGIYRNQILTEKEVPREDFDHIR